VSNITISLKRMPRWAHFVTTRKCAVLYLYPLDKESSYTVAEFYLPFKTFYGAVSVKAV